jgi:hypothetical protein
LIRALPSDPSVTLYDEYRCNVQGSYSNYSYTWFNADGTSGSTSETDWQYYRSSVVGEDATYNNNGEVLSNFLLKELSFLDLKTKVMVFLETTGEYSRTASSDRTYKNLTNTEYTATFSTSNTELVNIAEEDFDTATSSGNRTSTQSVSVILKKYGDSNYERFLSDPQEVEKEDSFSNSVFIDSTINFSVSANYDNTNEYDFTPSFIFSYTDLHSSRSIASRIHINLENSIYLCSVFYQKINLYYASEDNIFGSYFPPVDEFYSYQLKGIDTNVPSSSGSALQEPTNPEGIDIGNQLCPIGFLKT